MFVCPVFVHHLIEEVLLRFDEFFLCADSASVIIFMSCFEETKYVINGPMI